jgi:hypothetical protein
MTECSDCGGLVSASSWRCVHCGATPEAMFAKQQEAYEARARERRALHKPGCWETSWNILVWWPLNFLLETIVIGLIPFLMFYGLIMVVMISQGFEVIPLVDLFLTAIIFYPFVILLRFLSWLVSLVWR